MQMSIIVHAVFMASLIALWRNEVKPNVVGKVSAPHEARP